MSELDKFGSAHECFSALLFAIDARELIRIACAKAGIPVPDLADVSVKDPRIELPALLKRARRHTVDLVFIVRDEHGEAQSVWVIEIQLTEDSGKPRRWAFYPLAFGVELDADGFMVLFIPEPDLRARIRRRIGRLAPMPILIERDQIERITDHDEARRRPELTILGALYHVHEPAPLDQRVAVFKAAWIAMWTFADERSLRYAVLVMAITPQAVVTPAIEELRESGDLDENGYELVSETERKGSTFHRGHQEGLEQGLEQARRVLGRSIVDVLELRGFTITEPQHERIASCQSIDTLERWYTAAKTAATDTSVDQLLA